MDDFIPQLHLNETAKYYLKDTAKWAKFLAIIGFIMSGLMALLGIFFGTIMSSIMSNLPSSSSSAFPVAGMGAGMGFFYVMIAAVYFLPCLYLFQFAKNAKTALETEDSELLAKAFDKHHSMYKFLGIFAAIMLGFYAIGIVVAIIGFSYFTSR